MTVKIVTDSSADLPAELVEEMGITVVPLYVRFGDNVYRDRVEMGEDYGMDIRSANPQRVQGADELSAVFPGMLEVYEDLDCSTFQ